MQEYKEFKHALNQNKPAKIKTSKNVIYKISSLSNLPRDTPRP